MGLFDFFSKGGSSSSNTTNSDNSTQNPQSNQAANSSTSQVSVPSVPDFNSIKDSYTQNLANVSYPMASTNQIENKEDNQSDPKDIMSANLNIPEVKFENLEYTDPSKHPVVPEVKPQNASQENLPEGVRVVTFDPNPSPSTDLVESNENALVNQEQSEIIVDANPQSQTSFDSNLQTQSTLQQTIPTENLLVENPYNTVNQTNTDDLPQLNNDFVYSSNSVENTMQTEVSPNADLLNQVSENKFEFTPEPKQEVDLNKEAIKDSNAAFEEQINNSDFVFNSNAATNLTQLSNSSENSTESSVNDLQNENSQNNLKEVVEQQSQVQNIESNVSQIQTNAKSQVNLENQPVTQFNNLVNTTEVLNPVLQENLVKTDIDLNEKTLPSQVSEDLPTWSAKNEQEIAEVGNYNTNSTSNILNPSGFDFENIKEENNPFKRVGFIGLNATQPNFKIIEKLNLLCDYLLKDSTHFIIDSAKGYGKTIFDKAKQSNIEIDAALLKPFYSNYSDESELGEYSKIKYSLYSTNSIKISKIISQSDILVIPEINTVLNLESFSNVWATSLIFSEFKKPIILLGKNWQALLQLLKEQFKLQDKDLLNLNICENAENAIELIKELKLKYLTNPSLKRAYQDKRDVYGEQQLQSVNDWYID